MVLTLYAPCHFFPKKQVMPKTKITHVPKVTGYVLICAHGMMFRKVKCDYNFQNLPSSFLKLLCIDVTYSPAGVLSHSEAARSWLWFSTDRHVILSHHIHLSFFSWPLWSPPFYLQLQWSHLCVYYSTASGTQHLLFIVCLHCLTHFFMRMWHSSSCSQVGIMRRRPIDLCRAEELLWWRFVVIQRSTESP